MSGLKLRLVPVDTMYANENVIKPVNTNIQFFFSVSCRVMFKPEAMSVDIM